MAKTLFMLKRFGSLIAYHMRDRLTIMLVPHREGRPRMLSIPHHVLYVGGICIIMAMVSSLYVVVRHVDYASASLDNAVLEGRLASFSKELIKQRDAVQEVKELEGELRVLLGLKTKKAILEAKGLGGPGVIDGMNAEKLGQNQFVFSPKEFDVNMALWQKEIADVCNDAQEIFSHIEKKREIYNAMPKMWPTVGHITSRFGYRINPITGMLELHKGIDIRNRLGTPIFATGDGRVTYAGRLGGYGKIVILVHGCGYSTRYAHMSRIVVKRDRQIQKGEIIGYMGSTGMSTGSHLHYEVRRRGKWLNPLRLIRSRR